MKNNPMAGVAMVLLAASLWGTTGTAQTFGSGELSSDWFGALRLVVASAFFAVFAWLTAPRGDGAAAGTRLPMREVLAAGLCMAVYNLAFFAGIGHTGVAVGTALALGSGPVWAGLLQSLISRQAPRAVWWAGTAAAVAGGVLMTLTGMGSGQAFSVGGAALCLLSGLAYAAYTLINKRLVRSASAARVTLHAFSVAALLAVPAAWWNAGAPTLRAVDGWAVAYVGVVTAGIAYLLFTHALRHISAATGVTLALFEPVMAFVLAIAIVGERPAPAAFAGLLLVILGVLVVVRAELKAHASPRPSAPHGAACTAAPLP